MSYRSTLIKSEQKIRIMTYLGTSIDFIDGARVHFEEGASLPADAPVPVACDVCQKA
jgi:hypothetical protein